MTVLMQHQDVDAEDGDWSNTHEVRGQTKVRKRKKSELVGKILPAGLWVAQIGAGTDPVRGTLGESVVKGLSSYPSLENLQQSKLFCALNLTKWLSSTRCENDIKIKQMQNKK